MACTLNPLDSPPTCGFSQHRRGARFWRKEHIVELSKQGFFICLASKNEEEDVLKMFKERKDFPLQLEHITKHYVSWKEKSYRNHSPRKNAVPVATTSSSMIKTAFINTVVLKLIGFLENISTHPKE